MSVMASQITDNFIACLTAKAPQRCALTLYDGNLPVDSLPT